MDIEFNSGPASILHSGVLLNFDNHPIEIKFNGAQICICFVKNKEESPGIRFIPDNQANRVVFKFINTLWQEKLPKPVKIGDIDIYEDDELSTQDLFIDLLFTPLITTENQFKIEYFIFSVEKSNGDG